MNNIFGVFLLVFFLKRFQDISHIFDSCKLSCWSVFSLSLSRMSLSLAMDYEKVLFPINLGTV